MTISKFLPVLCAAALGAGCFAASAQSSAQDPDNPDQAAARIALAKSLFSMQDTNAVMSSTNAMAMTSSDTNMVMHPVDNTETKKEAKARAKAEKEAAKAAARQKAADEKAAREAAEAQAKQDAAAAKAQKEAQEKADKDAAAAQARADKENKLAAEQASVAAAAANTNAAPSTPSATPTPAATPAPSPTPTAASANPAPAVPMASSGSATNNSAGKSLGMQPMTAPPLPINGTKQEQLQALLEKYKADQITPEQYHQQRAAILAEP